VGRGADGIVPTVTSEGGHLPASSEGVCVVNRHNVARMLLNRWHLGVRVREYRELQAGTRFPTFGTWDRMCDLFGWSQRSVGSTPED
jgi:hypothetical protein